MVPGILCISRGSIIKFRQHSWQYVCKGWSEKQIYVILYNGNKTARVKNMTEFLENLKEAANDGSKLLRDQVNQNVKEFEQKGVAFEFQLVAEIYHALRNKQYQAGFRRGLFLETNYGGLHVDMVYTDSSGKEHLVEVKPVRTLKKKDSGLRKGYINKINEDLIKLEELSDSKIAEKILIVAFIGDSKEWNQKKFGEIVRRSIKLDHVKLVIC